MIRAALRELGRIRVRLLIVNLVVLLVPVAGLEFARLYERQLLHALERDMRDQAALVRALLEEDMRQPPPEGLGGPRPMTVYVPPRIPLDDEHHQRVLVQAARTTRMRVRVLDAHGQPLLDSHRDGPPEGEEPPAPTVIPRRVYGVSAELESRRGRSPGRLSADTAPDWLGGPQERWPDVPDRREVRLALEGSPASYTRVRDRAPVVILFVTEPIRYRGGVVGAVYVTRSTQPVLVELYRIRTGLIKVLLVAILFSLLLTLALALSISRPLARLARAARRIARGERGVPVPVEGRGEIREVAEAFATMTHKLDARMRYISEFAADVAHEFKSPLTSIRGAAELLGEGAAEDPETRARFLTNIQLDAERMDRLVSRLLTLSRIDASREPMEPFDLAALVTRVVERTHTEEQPVEVRWGADVRRGVGREHDLERALLNLVENALRFSPEGAPIRVVVERRRGELHLAVEDRGPGVPEAHRHKVFERFFTTDSERSGTGLGLSIVLSVAEAHGGRVELSDVEGGGARFTLVIPQGAE